MTSKEHKNTIIAFGSNASDALSENAQHVCTARDYLIDAGLELHRFSPLYQTPAFPAGAGPDFINAVGVFKCNEDAQTLLALLHQVEANMGRVRRTRWAQRLIDLDLLDLSGQFLPSKKDYIHWQNMEFHEQLSQAPDDLILPHPRIQDRAFVLFPLASAAPDWIHPALHKTAAELLADLSPKSRAKIHRYKGTTGLQFSDIPPK